MILTRHRGLAEWKGPRGPSCSQPRCSTGCFPMPLPSTSTPATSRANRSDLVPESLWPPRLRATIAAFTRASRKWPRQMGRAATSGCPQRQSRCFTAAASQLASNSATTSSIAAVIRPIWPPISSSMSENTDSNRELFVSSHANRTCCRVIRSHHRASYRVSLRVKLSKPMRSPVIHQSWGRRHRTSAGRIT